MNACIFPLVAKQSYELIGTMH